MAVIMYSPFYWDVEVISTAWNTANVKIPKKLGLSTLYNSRDEYLDFIKEENLSIKKRRDKLAKRNKKTIDF